MHGLFGPPRFPSLQVRESDELQEISRGREIAVSEGGISESIVLSVVWALRADNASLALPDVLTYEEISQGLKVFSNGSAFPPLYCESGLVGGGDIIMEILRKFLVSNNTCRGMVPFLKSQSWECWSKYTVSSTEPNYCVAWIMPLFCTCWWEVHGLYISWDGEPVIIVSWAFRAEFVEAPLWHPIKQRWRMGNWFSTLWLVQIVGA